MLEQGLITETLPPSIFIPRVHTMSLLKRYPRNWTQTALIFDADHSQTALNASYRKGTDSFAFNPLLTPNQHTTQRINATLSQNRKMGSVDVSFGFQTDWQDIVSTDRGDHQTISNAAFILAQKGNQPPPLKWGYTNRKFRKNWNTIGASIECFL